MATEEVPMKMAVYTGACVGMQYRSKAGIEAMVADDKCEYKLSVIAEPSNKYNPKAIAVYYAQHHIGYIPDDKLEEAHEFLAWKKTVTVTSAVSFINQAKLDPQTQLPVWIEFGIEVEYV